MKLNNYLTPFCDLSTQINSSFHNLERIGHHSNPNFLFWLIFPHSKVRVSFLGKKKTHKDYLLETCPKFRCLYALFIKTHIFHKCLFNNNYSQSKFENISICYQISIIPRDKGSQISNHEFPTLFFAWRQKSFSAL